MSIVSDDKIRIKDGFDGRLLDGKFSASFYVVEEENVLRNAGQFPVNRVAMVNLEHGAAQLIGRPISSIVWDFRKCEVSRFEIKNNNLQSVQRHESVMNE